MTIDQRKLIPFLHRTGHFWRPGHPNGYNVTADDLKNLDIRHRMVKDAIASWQSQDANFEFASLDKHHRSILPDGDIGPVTELMLDLPRCPLPDWAPPDNAALPIFSEDPHVQRQMEGVVESMRQFATGSGSWPVPGCDTSRPNRDREHSTRVNIDTSNASSHQKAILREATRLVEQCEAEMGQAVRHIFDGDPNEAEHAIAFEGMRGGILGYNYFPEAGKCNQVVAGRINNSYNVPAEDFAVLLLHEYKGHGDGAQHTRGGIMNPSILRIRPLSWKGDPHEPTKRRWFGGDPVVDVPTDPIPPDQPGEIPYGTVQLQVGTTTWKLHMIEDSVFKKLVGS